MAKKSKKSELELEEDDLGAGIEDDEDDLVKLIEPEPNQNKSGVFVEDYVAGGEAPAPEPYPAPEPATKWKAEKVEIPDGMTASAREQLEAEIKAGRDALKKIKSGG